MKNYNGELEYKNKKYSLPFNLNVMKDIQEKYGSIDRWAELTDGTVENDDEPNAEAVIFGFTAMMNEGIDIENEEKETNIKLFSEKQVARIITEVGLMKAVEIMNKTVIESTKSDEKNA